MLTRADFDTALENRLASYPELLALYRAGDPIFLRQLDQLHIALSMQSSMQEVALAEPHVMSRPATVKAAAALKGIIPKATPARIAAAVVNNNSSQFVFASGRELFDSVGRSWVVERAATIDASGEGTVILAQYRTDVVDHDVSESKPFYFVAIPDADDGSHLAGLRVSGAQGEFRNAQGYKNIGVGELVYHVESDHRQTVYVRFGSEQVVGYQPARGERVTIEVQRSEGAVTPRQDSPFAFARTESPSESNVTIKMAELLTAGTNPPTVEYLRQLVKYPGIYDDDAVTIGDFEFLVRRHFIDLQFASVWNESVEEDYRPPSFTNINCLFIAVFNGDESVRSETSTVVSPQRILSHSLTDLQRSVLDRINRADNTKRVVFYTPVLAAFHIDVSVELPGSYVASTVESAIRELLLNHFGQYSDVARNGRNTPRNRDVMNLLESIPALSDENSDFSVVQRGSSDGDINRPELWRFVTDQTIHVSITTKNTQSRSWGS